MNNITSWMACLLVSLSAGVFAATDLASLQPLSLTSSNGLLEADLVIKNIDTMINGHHVMALKTYNGTFPGPTFHAQAGDTLRIRYINRLPPNEASSGGHSSHGSTGAPHGFNTVNLHTHGVNVSPEGFSDNVLLEIEPGHWVPYEFKIPTNHPSGFFWYHPHKHGAVNSQLGAGLSGNLFLNGGPGDLEQIAEIKNAKKFELILNQIQLVPYTNQPGHWYVPDFPLDSLTTNLAPGLQTIYTLNGQPIRDVGAASIAPPPLPQITIRPGEVQRLQFLNASVDKFFWLTISNDAGGTILPMQMISFDGITLPAPETRDGIFLAPANRAEFLIKGPASGTYTLKSIAAPTGVTSDDRHYANMGQIFGLDIAKIVVTGATLEMPLPTTLNPPFSRLPDIADNEVVRRRDISMDMSLVPNPGVFTDPEGYFLFTMNHKPFDPNRIDETIFLNSVEEWTLRVTDNHSAHPFHIHVNWFQVLEINGVPLSKPRWQDTTTVLKLGTVKIRSRFEYFTGKFVMHCHIVRHEDAGMMAQIEIIDPPDFLYGFDGLDPEGDGYINLFHYAFGFPSNFRHVKPAQFPTFGTTNVGGLNYQAVTFNRRAQPFDPLEYHLEGSNDLFSWQSVNTQVGTAVPTTPGFERVTFRDTVAVGSQSARFLRMNVNRKDYAPMPIPAGFPQ